MDIEGIYGCWTLMFLKLVSNHQPVSTTSSMDIPADSADVHHFEPVSRSSNRSPGKAWLRSHPCYTTIEVVNNDGWTKKTIQPSLLTVLTTNDHYSQPPKTSIKTIADQYQPWISSIDQENCLWNRYWPIVVWQVPSISMPFFPAFAEAQVPEASWSWWSCWITRQWWLMVLTLVSVHHDNHEGPQLNRTMINHHLRTRTWRTKF